MDENSIQDKLTAEPGSINTRQFSKGVFIHEIGHNLGGNHGDPGNIMGEVSSSEIMKNGCVTGSGNCGTGIHNYSLPSVNRNGIRAISGRIGMPYGSVNSNYLRNRENNKVAREGGETVGKIHRRNP